MKLLRSLSSEMVDNLSSVPQKNDNKKKRKQLLNMGDEKLSKLYFL